MTLGKKYKIILDRYFDMVKHIPMIKNGTSKTSLNHAVWMLEEMKNFDDELKFMRWLGFVQAILIMRGFTDVDTERDFTRPILKGKNNV